MSWFFIALLAPFLFAVVVHLDKYLISLFKGDSTERGVGGLVLYSSLFGLIISGVLFIILGPSSLTIPGTDILILTLAGLCGITAVILYLYAMEMDEASIVAPLFQTVPIFGLFFEYFILGIIPTTIQIIGSLIIVIAGIVLASELEGFKIKKIKGSILLLMLSSSMFFALISILFKFVTVEGGDFWVSSFWEYLAWGVSGLILLMVVKSYRVDFLNSLKHDGKTLFSLNITGELTNSIANSAKNFAALLVPVTLVYSVEALQPIFIFLIGIIITVFAPKISQEDISKTALLQKGVPILFMIIGTIIMLI